LWNRKIFIFIEEILFVSIFQYVFYNFFNFKIVPSFFLIYLLLLSFEGMPEISILLSFFLGILNDLFTKEVPGTTSIKYLLIVYFSSFFVVKSNKERNFYIFVFSFLYFVFGNFKRGSGFMWKGLPLLKYALLFSFYNLLVSIIFEFFIREIKRRWKESFF